MARSTHNQGLSPMAYRKVMDALQKASQFAELHLDDSQYYDESALYHQAVDNLRSIIPFDTAGFLL